MCFSATASFAAGTALSATGVVTTAKTKTKKELPFAMVPLLFGIQQLTEGFVWLSLSWHAAALNFITTYIFSLFAFVVWPVYVPFAVGLMETVAWRKKAIYVCQAAGILVGGYLLFSHTLSPVTSEIIGRHVVYNNSHFYQWHLYFLVFLAILTAGMCVIGIWQWRKAMVQPQLKTGII